MHEEIEEKNIFFGFEVDAPWPDVFPSGKLIEEKHRHITLAFFGKNHSEKILEFIDEVPKPPFRIGKVGKFDKCLTLPDKRDPRVLAWHGQFFEAIETIENFQKKLVRFLKEKGYEIKDRFLTHVTMARKPFQSKDWEEAFTPLPFYIKSLHLYESLGYSKYKSLWEYPFILPFEEISHTADIAFHVRGETMQNLHLHAKCALGFAFPPIIAYFTSQLYDNLDAIVMDLNEIVLQTDCEIGCGFKAVSFTGNIKKDEKNQCLMWEMVIDV